MAVPYCAHMAVPTCAHMAVPTCAHMAVPTCAHTRCPSMALPARAPTIRAPTSASLARSSGGAARNGAAEAAPKGGADGARRVGGLTAVPGAAALRMDRAMHAVARRHIRKWWMLGACWRYCWQRCSQNCAVGVRAEGGGAWAGGQVDETGKGVEDKQGRTWTEMDGHRSREWLAEAEGHGLTDQDRPLPLRTSCWKQSLVCSAHRPVTAFQLDTQTGDSLSNGHMTHRPVTWMHCTQTGDGLSNGRAGRLQHTGGQLCLQLVNAPFYSCWTLWARFTASNRAPEHESPWGPLACTVLACEPQGAQERA